MAHPTNFIDLTNQRFGMLLVLREIPKEQRRKPKMPEWVCLCDCGRETIKTRGNLRKGDTNSCGKHLRGAKKTHGDTGSIEHGTWHGIRKRCSPKARKQNLERYYNRGICMCKGWLNSFESFLEDMGRRPPEMTSIDRIDNDGNYSCGHCEQCLEMGWTFNCRWGDVEMQCRNRSDNHWEEMNGKRMIVADWTKEFNTNQTTLSKRIKKYGWEATYKYYTERLKTTKVA